MLTLKNWYFEALYVIERHSRVAFWLIAAETVALIIAAVL